jgi:energy-coupling factor transporter ATP-binding protein EcfA2
MRTMLEVTNAQVVYHDVIQAVRDVSPIVPQGKIVALLGVNGAVKSTLLKEISNVLYPEGGSNLRDGEAKLLSRNQDILECYLGQSADGLHQVGGRSRQRHSNGGRTETPVSGQPGHGSPLEIFIDSIRAPCWLPSSAKSKGDQE